MTGPPEVIDLTESSKVEPSSSRKHDQHERDPRVEGPSKRSKLQISSESPLRKDTSTTPKQPKKWRKSVDNREATRAKTYHELKESNKTLELELAGAKQAKKDMEQELDSAKLERVQKLRNEKSQNFKKPHAALQEACQEKDKALSVKEKDIASKQRELDEKTVEAAIYKQKRDEPESSLGITNKERASMEEKLAIKTRELAETQERLEKIVKENEGLRTINDSNGLWNPKLTKKVKQAKESQTKARNGLSPQ